MDATGFIQKTAREDRAAKVGYERNPEPHIAPDNIVAGIEKLLGTLARGGGDPKEFPMLKALFKARLDAISKLKPEEQKKYSSLIEGKLTPKQRFLIEIAGPDIMAALEETIRTLQGRGKPGWYYAKESLFTQSARKNAGGSAAITELPRYQHKLRVVREDLHLWLMGVHNTLPRSRQDPLRRVLGRIALWSGTPKT
jgi:hypothetical protein